MTLDFLDRSSPSATIERVWRSRSSSAADAMFAVAHTGWDLVAWRDDSGTQIGLQGTQPEAAMAPVPPGAEFTGIRFPSDWRLAAEVPHPRAGEFVPLDTDGRGFLLGGRRWLHPRFDDAEVLTEALIECGLLVLDPQRTGSAGDVSLRTIQRRFKRATGMTPTHARQVRRARNAAVDLIEGESWDAVCHTHGFYDQAHLSRSLRRFIGLTPTALRLRHDHRPPLSLLYKTTGDGDS